MLQSFVSSISYFFLFLLIVVIASLSQLGINTSSLVALIWTAGLAVGLALQNFAGGTSRKVEKMGLLMLELRTGDNKTILVPNGKVFADNIANYSCNETRRIDLILDISYKSDIEKAKTVVTQVLANEKQS